MKFLLVLLMLMASSANAKTTYVSPSGNDSNDCLTPATACRQIQAAADKTGGSGMVEIAAGSYAGGANISHFKDITFEGVCGANDAVLVNVSAGQPGFWIQDNSIGIIRCLRIAGVGSSAVAILSRQFSIVDYSEVNFYDFPNGGHVHATEMSKVNCGGNIVIYGSAVYHIQAEGMSSVLMPCQISFANNPTFNTFLTVIENSFVNTVSTVYIGVAGSCQSFVVMTALLRLSGSYGIPCTVGGVVYYGGQAY